MRGLLAAGLAAALVLVSAEAVPAQLLGARLTGTIEEEAGQTRYVTGTKVLETLTLGSRYAPNIDGFVLDPRLFTFSYGGSFVDQSTRGEQSISAMTVEPYRLQITAFPYGLHTFTVQASRSSSEIDFETGTSGIKRNTWGSGWVYRGGDLVPQASLSFTRETIDETFIGGEAEARTRSTAALRLHREFDRFRPTLNYTFQTLASETDRERTVERDGVRHQVVVEDRIRVGERAILTPIIDFRTAPEGRDANATAALTVPVTPSVDAAGTMRYSFFERESAATHTTAAQGEITKRFTDGLILTSGLNGVYVTSDQSSPAWSGGGLTALRATPFRDLRGVVDYALQLSRTDVGSTVSHRGHVSGVGTFVPKHTITADYFLSSAGIAGTQGSQRIEGRTFSLAVDSRLVPRTALTGDYSFDTQEFIGRRQRHTGRLGAEVLPVVALTARAGVEAFTEQQSGVGSERRTENTVISSGALGFRPAYWMEFGANGRYGVKDIERELRPGRFVVAGVSGSVGFSWRTLMTRIEGFYDKDEDLDERRRGVRGNLAYRFRIWTITADVEFSTQATQGFEIGRQRAGLRLSRPLDFSWP